MSPDSVDALSELLWATVAGRPCSISGAWIGGPGRVACERNDPADGRYSDDFPVLDHLNTALNEARLAGFGAIIEAFSAVAPHLRWSQNLSYTEENCSRELLDGYAYAALSGPDGPLVCSAPRGGFMLMGPNVAYPAHNHAPREVYLVLTAGVQWSLDQGEWFDVAAGDLIVHEPWMWHGLRTTDTPMLAFAGWLEPGDRGSIGFAAD